ncbi:hypothetical protein KKA15_01285 [Patescibacteria group bacterium]|nr:hypothetical protein [Patescibacteria group bacterium]
MDTMVVGSKVKAYIKSKGCHTSSDTLGALNEKVVQLLEVATYRCKSNRRTTVKPQDL